MGRFDGVKLEPSINRLNLFLSELTNQAIRMLDNDYKSMVGRATKNKLDVPYSVYEDTIRAALPLSL